MSKPPIAPRAGSRRTRQPSAVLRRAGILLVLLGILAVAAAYLVYRHEMQEVRARLSAESQLVRTRHGEVEFATWGSGPPVLVLHGAGGGHDQGRSIAKAFGGDGLRWIAPSRFGYLRSTLPADPSTAAQADALAELLDHLGIGQAAVLAMSGGVPPALQFALRHPARASALVLVSSAPYTPLTAAEQDLPVPSWVYEAIFSSDFPYWALTKVGRSALEAIFDVKPDMRAGLRPEESAFLGDMVDAFQPVTERIRGLGNEVSAIDPRVRYPLEEIRVPALVVHAGDDGINPFSFGEHTARRIPGAEFLPLASGGHLLLGNHAALRARVGAFLREHRQGDAAPGPERQIPGAQGASAGL